LNEEILRSDIYNYYNNISTRQIKKENIENIGGKEAVSLLLKMCKNEYILLNEKAYSVEREEYSLFDVSNEILNGITGITNRRMVLKGFLLAEEKVNEHIQGLLKSLDFDIGSWNSLKRILIKNYCDSNFLLDKSYQNYFEAIIKAEDEIFKYLSKIYAV
jgi:hypothetical protein